MFKPKFKNEDNSIFTNLKRKCHTAMLLVVIFVFSVFTAYAAPQAKHITIKNGDRTIAVLTNSSTVEKAVRERGINFASGDKIIPSLESEVYDGMTITIKYSKKVNLISDGYSVTYDTTADTYREFLKENNIAISPEDVTNVNLDDRLNETNKLSITRVSTLIYEEDEEIPYTSTKVNDATIPMGQTRISQQGQKGVKKICYEVVKVDGVEISKTYAGEYIAKQPVNEVVSVGTSSVATTVSNSPGLLTTSGGETLNYKKVIKCQATAYDLSFQSTGKRPGHPAYGITASGTYAKMGTVAVDPRVIPLGTKMYIVSTDGSVVYGYCTAEDTGGAIKGNKVDLFYNTTSECMQFGRRSVYVYIL